MLFFGDELLLCDAMLSPERVPLSRRFVARSPFWPAYVTEERLKRAPKLKMALTAGIGSDHVDLLAASKAGLTVAEITGACRASACLCLQWQCCVLKAVYMLSWQHKVDQQPVQTSEDKLINRFVEHWWSMGSGCRHTQSAPAVSPFCL